MFGTGTRRKAGEGAGHGPAKRMTIRLKKATPQLPPNFLEESWAKLEETIHAIHDTKTVVHSREELYHMVEGLCIHKQAAELCKRLEAVLEKHIEGCIAKLVGQLPDHVAFLGLVTDTWQAHCQHMQSIRNLFLYLDRSYVISDMSLRSLWDMGLSLFRKYLEKAPEVQNKIIEGFLHLIEKERSGEVVNHSVCMSVVRMLVALQLYESKFESVFLQESAQFYRQESTKMLGTSLVQNYLEHVEKRLHEERQRVARYLDQHTRGALIRSCESELVAEHVPFLLEKGFDGLMDDGRSEDLRRMYTLFERVDALTAMKTSLSKYIKQRGEKIVQNEVEEKDMVDNLLKLKKSIEGLMESAFSQNPDFERAVGDSIEQFINSRENRPAELIAKFIDLQLRSGGKGPGGEEATEALLEKVIALFRYLSAKDVFEAFYKKDLAKRLLLGRSSSSDLERSMIAKLKTECGSNFTNKLEGMFKDVELSKDLMSLFQKSPQYVSRPKDIEISVFVLTTGFWPAYPPMKGIKLHEDMLQCQSVFEGFYYGKHEGRRLTWQPSLGHCLVGASLPTGRKEFQVSLCQALVLLQFNACASESDKLSYKAIEEQTGIETNELHRTLLSLACGKVRVLSKEPKGPTVAETDTFAVNSSFESKQFRIKINSIQLKETAKEVQQTHERVFQDRQYQVDAAIVRIMKSRKVLSHTLLLAELFKQLRFPCNAANIKKRVESLIDREYLERDETDKETYKYLA
mmetsp:Transcript_13842/g.25616  ORF Transcript_13842/g.25616 Transcript_13842/m.25616 type:complete len:744 (-) Transcript_13842:92-2323(-)